MERTFGFLCPYYDAPNGVTYYYNLISEVILRFKDNGDYWFHDFEREQSCVYNYEEDTTDCQADADTDVNIEVL